MSLINDMLQDLDRRGAHGRDKSAPDPNEFDALRNAAPDLMASSGYSARPTSAPSIWWPGMLVSLAAAGLAVALVIGFWNPSSSSGEPPLQAAETTAVEVKVEEPGNETVRTESAQVGLDAESFERALQPRAQVVVTAKNEALVDPFDSDEPDSDELDSDVPGAQGQRISALLKRAQTARSRDRLTRPSDDNAYDYYQQILVQAPNHPEAIAGLAAIARRYRELVEVALDNDDLDSARGYLQRARSIDPEAVGLDASSERLQRLSPAQATDEPEPATLAKAEGASRLSVSPDMESRDRRRAQVGRELWAQGDQTGALRALEETLADFKRSSAQAPVSTSLLIELYLQANDPSSAEILLEQSDYLSISESTRLKAQLDLHGGYSARALADLEAQLGSAEDNELYRALLARLYFAEDRFPEAGASYRGLLSDFGEDPAYWLGLGLAEDAQGKHSEALQAFIRARDRGGYSRNNGREDAIHRYLERRIDALTRQLNAQGS